MRFVGGSRAKPNVLRLTFVASWGWVRSTDCIRRTLANHLAVPVVPLLSLRQYGASQNSIAHLTSAGQGDFSALTVFHGTFRLIVVNPAHSIGRQANSVVHELSHVILEHEPHEAMGVGGCRTWDQEMEVRGGLARRSTPGPERRGSENRTATDSNPHGDKILRGEPASSPVEAQPDRCPPTGGARAKATHWLRGPGARNFARKHQTLVKQLGGTDTMPAIQQLVWRTTHGGRKEVVGLLETEKVTDLGCRRVCVGWGHAPQASACRSLPRSYYLA